MISPRTNLCKTALILILICPAAWAVEPNETPIHLEFEMGSTPLGPYSASNPLFNPGSPQPWEGWSLFASAKPAYAADIVIVGPTHFLPFPRTVTWEYYLMEFAMQRAGLSEGQKALLLGVQRLFQAYPRPLRDYVDPNHPEHLPLYAVTAEDARKMAQAYYQSARAQFRREAEARDKAIRELSAKIVQDEKRILEVDALVATTEKELAKLVRAAPYHAEREAQDAVGELDRMLHAAQVELAGIKARIEAIEAYRAKQHEATTPGAAKLDLMFIEESVALRGAQAREETAQRLREQANRFLDLTSTLARATAERKALPESLESHRRQLAASRNVPWPNGEEPRIPAKVTICTVQWADEAPQK